VNDLQSAASPLVHGETDGREHEEPSASRGRAPATEERDDRAEEDEHEEEVALPTRNWIRPIEEEKSGPLLGTLAFVPGRGRGSSTGSRARPAAANRPFV